MLATAAPAEAAVVAPLALAAPGENRQHRLTDQTHRVYTSFRRLEAGVALKFCQSLQDNLKEALHSFRIEISLGTGKKRCIHFRLRNSSLGPEVMRKS
ncbi:hypothetical protein KSD_58320 [Ktedonobacter sp. SOSP1-85]|nr:hypothetical protein KSD_58320 [Ktedonobacter sp. SOSP1-85]